MPTITRDALTQALNALPDLPPDPRPPAYTSTAQAEHAIRELLRAQTPQTPLTLGELPLDIWHGIRRHAELPQAAHRAENALQDLQRRPLRIVQRMVLLERANQRVLWI